MVQSQDIRDRVPTDEWATFRRCRFELRTFHPYSCLSATDGGWWIPYRGQPFDPAAWELVEGMWDHEHCDVCHSRIVDGDAYWTNGHEAGGHVDLCEECHPRVLALLPPA